eukprot:5787984-Pleurochrysis_carterae.AAC.4
MQEKKPHRTCNKKRAVASSLGEGQQKSAQQPRSERLGHTQQACNNLASNDYVESNEDKLAMVSHKRGSGRCCKT